MSDTGKRAANPRQREFFDSAAASWDETVRHDMGKLESIVSRLGLADGDSVMDIGSGTGVAVPLLAERVGPGGRVICVDYSPEMIAISKRKHPPELFPGVEFMVGDAGELRADAEMDAVLCYSCFPHFLDQAGMIRHLASGLREGGRLMVAHSQSRDDINQVHREGDEAVVADHLPPMGEIRGMMEAAGLEVVGTVDDERMFCIISRRRSDLLDEAHEAVDGPGQ